MYNKPMDDAVATTVEEAQALLDRARKDGFDTPLESGDIESMLRSARRNGTNGAWRRDLTFLMTNSSGVRFTDLCELAGVSPTIVMVERRRDPQFEALVRAYQGHFYEREAEAHTDIKPQVVTLGLKARAGWAEEVGTLTVEQVRDLLHKVLFVIRRRVADVEVRKQIGEDLLRLEAGTLSLAEGNDE